MDECATAKGDCDHICNNKPGSFECSCNDGYILGRDGKNCTGKINTSVKYKSGKRELDDHVH